MLPPVSEPSAPYARPAATETPDPDDETPVQRSAAQGFTGGATSGWWFENAPSVSLTLPRMTAPAALSRVTTVASSGGSQSASTRVPHVVTISAVQSRSLSAIGTPCRGPRGSPCARRASSASACASARSPVTVTYALSSGSRRPMRASIASVTATAENSPLFSRRQTSDSDR